MRLRKITFEINDRLSGVVWYDADGVIDKANIYPTLRNGKPMAAPVYGRYDIKYLVTKWGVKLAEFKRKFRVEMTRETVAGDKMPTTGRK